MRPHQDKIMDKTTLQTSNLIVIVRYCQVDAGLNSFKPLGYFLVFRVQASNPRHVSVKNKTKQKQNKKRTSEQSKENVSPSLTDRTVSVAIKQH